MEEHQTHQNTVTISLVCISISFYLFYLWRRRELYRFAYNFPGFFGLPLFGIAFSIGSMKNAIPYFESIFEKYRRNTLCIWTGPVLTLLTREPEYIEKILTSSLLLNKSSIYKPFREADGGFGGLVCLSAEKWLPQRKHVNPAFRHRVLRSFLPIFNKAKDSVIRLFEGMADNGIAYNVHNQIKCVSFGTAAETTMGVKHEEQEFIDENIAENFGITFSRMTNGVFLSYGNLHWLLLLDRTYQRAKRKTYNYIQSLSAKRLKVLEELERTQTEADSSLEKSDSNYFDLMVKQLRRNVLSYEEFRQGTNEMILAAVDTVTTVAYSTLVLLAQHPEKQQRLFEEILAHYPDKNFDVDYELLDQTPYLNQVIDEVLRLLPPVPVIGRRAVNDVTLSDGLKLPQGVEIMISIFHLQRRKDIWGETANEFEPDRYLNEKISDKHPYAFVPFSKGVRGCIGWRYALMVLKIMLAGLVRNYRFETDMKYEELRFTLAITLEFVKKPKLRVYRR